jgi:hypothetical protein
VPFCEQCGRALDAGELVVARPASPSAAASGSGDDAGAGRNRCPTCGGVLESAGEPAEEQEEIHPRAPWHFKVLVVGSVVYLGYRLYQGIGWLIHHA